LALYKLSNVTGAVVRVVVLLSAIADKANANENNTQIKLRIQIPQLTLMAFYR